MNETTRKLLQGRLMLLAASLFFVTAILNALWGGSRRASLFTVFFSVGVVFFCVGMRSLRRARRPK